MHQSVLLKNTYCQRSEMPWQTAMWFPWFSKRSGLSLLVYCRKHFHLFRKSLAAATLFVMERTASEEVIEWPAVSDPVQALHRIETGMTKAGGGLEGEGVKQHVPAPPPVTQLPRRFFLKISLWTNQLQIQKSIRDQTSACISRDVDLIIKLMLWWR